MCKSMLPISNDGLAKPSSNTPAWAQLHAGCQRHYVSYVDGLSVHACPGSTKFHDDTAIISLTE